MLNNLVKIVACFYLCFSVTISSTYYKNSDRTYKKYQQTPKAMSTYDHDSYYKQSRYTKFDKVKSRIEKLNLDDDISEDAVYRIRHKGVSVRRPLSTTPSTTTTTTSTIGPEMDLFETYGEMENEDEFEDYDGNLDDDDDDLDYADDEDDDSGEERKFFDTIDEDIQAEEPTTSTMLPRIVSKLTEYKWNHFGTRARVEESMREQLNIKPSREQLKVKAVIDHYTRVNQQSKCLTPLPRVISVQQEHPDPSKTYIPACTVLHRCAEDSGCCKRDTKCQYKTRVLVPLYFYAKFVGQNHNTIERLDFYNHTECECKNNTDDVPLEIGKVIDSKASQSQDEKNLIEKTDSSCVCPKPYQLVPGSQKCSCDCDKSDQDCITLKKGKEHFSMTNRICIQDNECGLPSCEYGAYMFNEGKCPTKQDKLDGYRKIRINN